MQWDTTMETNVQPINPFFQNIEPRFDKFKAKMCALAQKNKMSFNEDVFMDTLIRCMKTFTKEDVNNSEVDKYFWTAFRQNMISSTSREHFKNMTQIETIPDRIDDNIYNEDIDVMADMMETEIRREFGDTAYDAWRLHVCDELTYKELQNMGYGSDLHNLFKKIKRHMLRFTSKNTTFGNLVRENNLL